MQKEKQIMIEINLSQSVKKSPVGVLHEACCKRRVIPVYELLAHEGKIHEPTFVYRVIVDGVSTNGLGKSKKVAKQRAALRILEKLISMGVHADWGLPGSSAEEALEILHKSVCMPSSEAGDETSSNTAAGSESGVKAAAALHSMCCRNRWYIPSYEDAGSEGPTNNVLFYVSVLVGSLQATATGRSKKLAKQNAAQSLLDAIEQMSYEERQEVLAYSQEETKVTIQQPFPEMDEMFGVKGERDQTALQTCYEVVEDKVEKFFGTFDVDADYSPGNHVTMLASIGREERWDFEFLYVNKNDQGLDCVFLQLATVPVAVVWGSGADIDLAKDRAAWNALCYLKIVHDCSCEE